MRMMSREKMETIIRGIFEEKRAGYEKELNDLEMSDNFNSDDVKKILSKYINQITYKLGYFGINCNEWDISKFITYSKNTKFDDIIEKIYNKNKYEIKDNVCYINKDLLFLDTKIRNFMFLYEILTFEEMQQGKYKFWKLPFGKTKFDKFTITIYKTKKQLEIKVL